MFRLHYWYTNIKKCELFSIIINIAIIVASVLIFKTLLKDTFIERYYYKLFIVKILYAVVYILIYKYYYVTENDSVCYHHDSRMFNWYFWNNNSQFWKIFLFSEYECPEQMYEFWMSRLPSAFKFVKILSLISIFLTTNYWLQTIYLSVLSFFSSVYLSNELLKRFPKIEIPVVLVFFCWPSLQLWSSGLLKENLAITFFFVLIASFLSISRTLLLKVFLIVFSIYVLAIIKSYYLIILPFLVLYSFYEKFGNRVFIYLTIFSLILLGFTFDFWTQKLNYFKQVLLYSYDVSYFTMYNIKSNFIYKNITTNSITWLNNLFNIILNSIFGPFELPERSLFRTVEAVQNIFILFCSIFSLTNLILYKRKFSSICWFIILFVFCCSFFIGISVANIGAIVRIRIFYEYFTILLSIIIPIEVIQNLVKDVKKRN